MSHDQSHLRIFFRLAAQRTQLPAAPTLKAFLSKFSGELETDIFETLIFLKSLGLNRCNMVTHISARMPMRMWPSLNSFRSEHGVGKVKVLTLQYKRESPEKVIWVKFYSDGKNITQVRWKQSYQSMRAWSFSSMMKFMDYALTMFFVHPSLEMKRDALQNWCYNL